MEILYVISAHTALGTARAQLSDPALWNQPSGQAHNAESA
jgi:hypothetical protein